MDEQHIRQFRAILGAASIHEWPEGRRSFEGLRQAVLKSGVSEELYDRLHALAAAVFAQFACGETGPNGRTRTNPVQVVAPEAFAANHLRLPRHVVAEAASHSISNATTHRLAVIEEGRRASHMPATFVLLEGCVQGAKVLLTHNDDVGYRWQESAELPLHVTAEFDALKLKEFGLRATVVHALKAVPNIFMLNTHGDSGLSLRYVPHTVRAPSSYQKGGNKPPAKRGTKPPTELPPAFVDGDAELSLRPPPDGGKRASWGTAKTVAEARRMYAEEIGLDPALALKGADRTVRRRLQTEYETQFIRQQQAQAARAGIDQRPPGPPDPQLSTSLASYRKEQQMWASICGAPTAYDELDQLGGGRVAENMRWQRRNHVVLLAWARWRVAPVAERPSLPLQSFKTKHVPSSRRKHINAEPDSDAAASSRPRRTTSEPRTTSEQPDQDRPPHKRCRQRYDESDSERESAGAF